MKKLLVLLAALLMLLACTAATAEIQVESTTVENMPFLSRNTNCYYARVDGGYQLFDAQGNAISAVYKQLNAKSYGSYYAYYTSNGLNAIGVLDAQGKVLTLPMYGNFTTYDNGWALGFVLEAVEGDTGDFKDQDNNKFNAVRTDVFSDGRLIGSLTRDEYIPSYSAGVTGNYFYVRQTSESGYYLDKNFNKYSVTDRYVSSTEYEYDYKTKTVYHLPTQQKAFCADSPLTAEDVKCPVWFDDNTDSLLDLQGNVIKSGLTFDYMSTQTNYLRARRNSNYGIVDLQGNVIAEPIYKEIGYTSEGMFTNGYNIAITPEGHLHFLDKQGNITAKAEYELSAYDYKGYSNNALFACVKNMGKYMVFTATHGELSTKYEDVYTPGTNHQILLVKKDGLWGAIDTAGNTVLPFIHPSSPEISTDGTLVFGQNSEREYVRYNLTYINEAPEAPAAEQTPVADGTWACPECNESNTGKFCAECGVQKPVASDSWTCTCGSVNTGKFCPECGSKKPDVAPQCATCGHKPEGAMPKFCPECGSKF